MKYIKKPVEVEAFQVTVDYLREHIDKQWQEIEPKIWHQNTYLVIHTLEGEMRADIGDWIITGVKGEKYPCKPDIFEMTYEPVP